MYFFYLCLLALINFLYFILFPHKAHRGVISKNIFENPIEIYVKCGVTYAAINISRVMKA